jgi:ketosteroid isomerase-like protein
MTRAPLLQAALTVTNVRTTIRARGTLTCLVALGLLSTAWTRPSTAAAAPSVSVAGPEAGQDALWSRLRRIESAFRDGDAAALRSSFCSGKLRVDLPQVAGTPASYGAGQLQVIFGELFAGARTREFAFSRQEVSLRSPDTAFARGRWVRRGRDTDQADVLTFTLREEDGDWRIHEILSAR